MSSNQENNNSYISQDSIMYSTQLITSSQVTTPLQKIITPLHTFDIYYNSLISSPNINIYMNDMNILNDHSNQNNQNSQNSQNNQNSQNDMDSDTISDSESMSSLPELVELVEPNLYNSHTLSSISTVPTSSIDMSTYILSYLNQNISEQAHTTSAYPSVHPHTSGYNQSLNITLAHPYTSGYNQPLNTTSANIYTTSAHIYTTSAHPYTSGYNQYINTTSIPTSSNSNIMTQSIFTSLPTTMPTLPPPPTYTTTPMGMPNPILGTSPIEYNNMIGTIGVTGTHGPIGMSPCSSGMSGTNSTKISCIYDTFNFNAINQDKERVYKLKYNDETFEFSINIHDMLSHKNKKLHALVKKIENILKTSTDISLLSICKSILKKDPYINHLINNRIVIKI